MAFSSYQVELFYGSVPTGSGTATATNQIKVKEIPDLGSAPETLETTTTSDSMQTFILGIQSADALEFTANFDETVFKDIMNIGLDTDKYFEVRLGNNSKHGKFTFNGRISATANGVGVNEVMEMTITIAPSTPITFVPPTSS